MWSLIERSDNNLQRHRWITTSRHQSPAFSPAVAVIPSSLKSVRAARDWYSDIYERIRALISDSGGDCFLFTIALRNELDKITRLSELTTTSVLMRDSRSSDFFTFDRPNCQWENSLSSCIDIRSPQYFYTVTLPCYRWRIFAHNRREWRQLIWLLFLFSRKITKKT